MAKILIKTIQVNFALIPGEAGMKQHKSTWIVVIKLFAINYTITAIWLSLWLYNCFHTGHFEHGHMFFYRQAIFEYIIITSLHAW